MDNETKTKTPPVSDTTKNEMTAEQAMLALEQTVTCIATVTRGPQDAILIALETLAQLCIAFDVPLREMSATLMRSHEKELQRSDEEKKQDRDAARAMVADCHERAMRVRGEVGNVRATLQKMQQERAMSNVKQHVCDQECDNNGCDAGAK